MRFCARSASTLAAVLAGVPALASAADVPADPSNYTALLPTLQPGDTLVLAAGSYPRLTISGIHGTQDAWITIAGPASGEPAVVTSNACCNTVQLYDSSFVAIRGLSIDVGGLAVDAVNAKDTPSHDILVEDNIMYGFPAGGQQIVGVNTKVTVWNWTIRGNRIVEPGTGIYLGGSGGDTPFLAGTIEDNVIVNPVGYCMQIKHQNDYTTTPDMPVGPSRTVIRGNIFIKDDRPSPDGDRPNLLVGGFPDAGPGAADIYEIYGNLLFYNPREALLQATGRVSIHDNLFIGAHAGGTALVLQPHEGKTVKLAHVYNNTVFGGGTGISVSQMASEDDAVVGNLIFAATPIGGSITDSRDNLVGAEADAAQSVAAPAVALGAMDFYPLPGEAQGAALDLSKFADDVAWDRDYNGAAKGTLTFRGAYAGEGDDPCGPLDDVIDDCEIPGGEGGDDTSGGGGSGGGDGDTADAGDGASATGGGGDDGPGEGGTGGEGTGTAASSDDIGGGCGCRTDAPGRSPLGATWLVLLGLGAVRRLWYKSTPCPPPSARCVAPRSRPGPRSASSSDGTMRSSRSTRPVG